MADTVTVSNDGKRDTVTIQGESSVVLVDTGAATVVSVGTQGPAGPPGEPGTGGDKTYEQSFTNQSSVTVTHNLGKRPGVSVINSAHDVVKCPVNHINDNSLTVTFNGSFSGVVICN